MLRAGLAGDRRSRRRSSALLFSIGVLSALAGCTVPAPPGAAPLRYRDAIFNSLTITKGIPYGSAPIASGTQTLTLDLYRPSGDTQTKRPAVVWIHGGGFETGTSANQNMVRMATEFAKRGYVAVSINYRLLAKAPCDANPDPTADCRRAAPAAQHDAQAAVRWLRANATTYGIDPARIAVGGASAGAITALRVGADAQDVGSSGSPGYPSTVGAAISISGALASSVLFGPGDAPTLFFNGTADPLVPYASAAQNAAALYNAGVPVFFEPLDGAGHVPFAQYGDLFVSQSVNFAYFLLDLGHANGQPPAAALAFEKKVAEIRAAHPAVSRYFNVR